MLSLKNRGNQKLRSFAGPNRHQGEKDFGIWREERGYKRKGGLI